MKGRLTEVLKRAKRLSSEGLLVLAYIHDHKKASTRQLLDYTEFPPTTLARHITVLQERGLIEIDSEFKPFSYRLTDKGVLTIEGGAE